MGCLAANDAFWQPEERSWTLPDRLEGSNLEAGITGDFIVVSGDFIVIDWDVIPEFGGE